ncbi:hypothetical protein J6590_074408 [Homalodisca vitripennis]|nr:hypothetical protein J6590_074408 [Homalodisca vitripennis]
MAREVFLGSKMVSYKVHERKIDMRVNLVMKLLECKVPQGVVRGVVVSEWDAIHAKREFKFCAAVIELLQGAPADIHGPSTALALISPLRAWIVA